MAAGGAPVLMSPVLGMGASFAQLVHPQHSPHVAPWWLFAASCGDASIFGVVAPKNTSSGSWGSWLCITEELIKLGETQALEQGLFHAAENVVGLFFPPVFAAIHVPLALHGQGPEGYPSSVGRAGLHLGIWALMWGFFVQL